MKARKAPSHKRTPATLIRTELFGRKGVLIRGGLVHILTIRFQTVMLPLSLLLVLSASSWLPELTAGLHI